MTIILTYQPLPSSVSALVHANPDDSYTIIVNNALSDERKIKAVWHEVNHITGGDFYKHRSVDAVETACHDNKSDFYCGEDLEFFVKS